MGTNVGLVQTILQACFKGLILLHPMASFEDLSQFLPTLKNHLKHTILQCLLLE